MAFALLHKLNLCEEKAINRSNPKRPTASLHASIPGVSAVFMLEYPSPTAGFVNLYGLICH
jgi:hypothetical protein